MLIEFQGIIRARERAPGGTSAVYWQPGVIVQMRANSCATRAALLAHAAGAILPTVLPAAANCQPVILWCRRLEVGNIDYTVMMRRLQGRHMSVGDARAAPSHSYCAAAYKFTHEQWESREERCGRHLVRRALTPQLFDDLGGVA